jgi:hypothetical protein
MSKDVLRMVSSVTDWQAMPMASRAFVAAAVTAQTRR